MEKTKRIVLSDLKDLNRTKCKTKKTLQNEIILLKDGDEVFSTGVFLIRNSAVPGGWIVSGFEDDTFFDGCPLESVQNVETGIVTWYIDKITEN